MYSKYEFFLRYVTFLGDIVSCLGKEVDPMKIKAVEYWPRPLTPVYIQSYLGLVGYYWISVDDSSIGSPLTTLRQKKVKF